jgi:hypothetical protein
VFWKIAAIALAGLAVAAAPARADVVVAGGAPGATLTAGDFGGTSCGSRSARRPTA